MSTLISSLWASSSAFTMLTSILLAYIVMHSVHSKNITLSILIHNAYALANSEPIVTNYENISN
jgi:hypothetical protein